MHELLVKRWGWEEGAWFYWCSIWSSVLRRPIVNYIVCCFSVIACCTIILYMSYKENTLSFYYLEFSCSSKELLPELDRDFIYNSYIYLKMEKACEINWLFWGTMLEEKYICKKKRILVFKFWRSLSWLYVVEMRLWMIRLNPSVLVKVRWLNT